MLQLRAHCAVSSTQGETNSSARPKLLPRRILNFMGRQYCGRTAAENNVVSRGLQAAQPRCTLHSGPLGTVWLHMVKPALSQTKACCCPAEDNVVVPQPVTPGRHNRKRRAHEVISNDHAALVELNTGACFARASHRNGFAATLTVTSSTFGSTTGAKFPHRGVRILPHRK
jgi:hypothetical protein